MFRFFFDTVSDTAEADATGIELAGLEEARAQAIRLAGEMLQYHPPPIPVGIVLRVEVFNADRVPLFFVTVEATTNFPGPSAGARPVDPAPSQIPPVDPYPPRGYRPPRPGAGGG